jgi:hypothetical protein
MLRANGIYNTIFFMKGECMMKSYNKLCLSGLLIFSGMLIAMEKPQGPMNAEWFYAQDNPFKVANDLHQERKWCEAEGEYNKKLKEGVGSQYDQDMARLNLAACQMAQRKPSEHWSSFDAVIGIPQEQRLSDDVLIDTKNEKSVLVRTDQVGIGDIVHFMETTHQLKTMHPKWNVTVSVRPFLKNTLSDVIKGYGCELISEKDEQPKTDYITHIMGLFGHLKMDPAATKPDKIVLTAPERAVNVVNEQINSILAQKNKMVLVGFAGEKRPATLIGGRQLPHNNADYGRDIHPNAFQLLLKKHPNVVLMDCGTPISRVPVDEKCNDQYKVIVKEEQAFDTIVALAGIMSTNKKILALAADQGPSNVFARALNKEGQKRMAFIIPNPGEYDMRMEGEGSQYTQMISDCLVLKSKSTEVQNQLAVLEKALEMMTTDK